MKFEIYQGKNKEYYWRLRSRNGKIIADGSESYKRKRSALTMIKKIIQGNLPELAVIEDLSNGERIEL